MKQEQNIPDWMLERYALGELPPEKIAVVDAAVAGSEETGRRLGEIESHNRDFLIRFPDLSSLHRPSRSGFMERVGGFFRSNWHVLSPVAAVLIAVVLVFLPGGRETPPDPGNGIRIKGSEDALVVFQQTSSRQARLLEAGSVVRENDRLQVAFRSVRAGHAVVLSIDGRGAVTLHFPDNLRGSTRVGKGDLHLLGKSYILDDAPGFERFYLILSDTPLNPVYILTKARQLAAGAAGHGRIPGITNRQLSVLLRKGGK